MTLLEASVNRSAVDDSCRFCAVNAGAPDEPFARLGRGNRAVATIGPLVPLWSLVLGSSHVPASAWLSDAQRRDLFDDVEQLATGLGQGRMFYFEHGAADGDSPTACTTSHVHVHVLPVDFDVIAYADLHFPLGGDWLTTEIDQLRSVAGRDYLLAGELGGPAKLKLLHRPISQYFRRVIAHSIGRPHAWNWRTYPNVTEYRQTQDLLGGLVRPPRGHP